MHDLADHAFSPENIRAESGTPDGNERRWLSWTAAAEKLIGHSLDGDQKTEGYSLDYAFDAFINKRTAAEYVAKVRSDPAYRAA